jgi:Fe2+ or Zn2+ uptake regulation protein
VLHWLKEDGLISDADAENCLRYGINAKNKHPLNVLIDCAIVFQINNFQNA